MKRKQITYMANDFDKTFFFSTDHIQEFENEDDFVPVTVYDKSHILIRAELKLQGYKQIPNPDADFVPKYNLRLQREMLASCNQ